MQNIVTDIFKFISHLCKIIQVVHPNIKNIQGLFIALLDVFKNKYSVSATNFCY